MKLRFLLVSLIFLPQTIFAWTIIRNGGGGVYQNGQYMTFHSADIPVEATPLEIHEIPGIVLLLNQIENMALTPQTKQELLALIYPAGRTRSYYQVLENGLDNKLRNQIKAEYAKLTGLPKESLVVFAMTNENSQTFLLPEFYKLNEVQQAVILFHEGLWNIKNGITYSEIVSAEMTLEALIGHPTSKDAFFDFYSALNAAMNHLHYHPELLLHATYQYAFIDQPGPVFFDVTLEMLVGENFLRCVSEAKEQDLQECSAKLLNWLMFSGASYKTIFHSALVATLNNLHHPAFLCLKQEGDQGLFRKDISSWISIAKPGPELWKGFSQVFRITSPILDDNEFLKIYEGEVYWGTLGLCSAHQAK